MTAPLIQEYATRLRHSLPAELAEEAAARDTIAEFGDQDLVIGEFTRQAPGRRAARLLLATGPLAGSCWAVGLITSRAWAWPVPAAVRLAFSAVLLLMVLALLAVATSRRSYRRTRLTVLALPVILALDAAAVTATAAAAPAMTWPLGATVAVILTRITFAARTLPRLAAS